MHWDWIGLILNISGCIGNAHHKIWCWPVWLLGNIVWISYWIPRGEWAAAFMAMIYFGLNVYGFFNWRKIFRIRDEEIKSEV